MHARSSRMSYKDLLITYLRPQAARALLMTVLLVTSIGLQLVNPQILRYFIDTALAGSPATPLLFAGAIFVALALANQVVSIFATYVSENVAWTATNQLRTDLVAHCLSLDMAFHKAHTSGELIERIDGDVNTLATFFSQSVINLCGNILLIVGIIAILFYEDWRIGLTMGLFALIALFVLMRIRLLAARFWLASREKDAEFFSFLGEQLAGTADMRANGATNYVMQRFHKLLQGWFPVNRRSSMAGYAMWMTTLFLFACGNALALALGAYLWSTKAITIGTVYLIFYYTNLLNEPMEQIRTQIIELQQAGAGITRIRQLMKEQPTIRNGEGALLPSGAATIVFQDVTFGYLAEEPVLHNLSFTLPAGKVLGVLGRSGSGKTTLARLLLRLYDPQQGQISIGAVPIQDALIRDLHQHIGMVTQDVQLFRATVRDNLTFFKRSISDARILEVLEDVGLIDWYRSLPLGLDSELGAEGQGLSAGQAQLLAFTRVFLTDPGLIIFDEASSRLDPATEQLIEKTIRKLLTGRTAIVIAHRLTTLQRVDEIMVMERGSIIEHGSRAHLAADPTSRFYHLLQIGLEEAHS